MPFRHETVNHLVGELVRDQGHTQEIESFWVTLKRAHEDVYRKISKMPLGPIRQIVCREA